MLRDFKEMMCFQAGIFIGIVMWILIPMLVVLIGCLFYLPFAIKADREEMVKQHCVKTTQTRIEYQTQIILVGNTQIHNIVPVEEHLYTCDDYSRWR